MISLTVVVLTLGITFGGAYLVYKLNRKQTLHPMKRTPQRRPH